MVIDQERITIDCYTLPLASFDVVLNVQWLRTLGSILWDFVVLSMTFFHHNEVVRFRGIRGDAKVFSVHTSPKGLLEALLAAYDNLFTEPEVCPLRVATTIASTCFSTWRQWRCALPLPSAAQG